MKAYCLRSKFKFEPCLYLILINSYDPFYTPTYNLFINSSTVSANVCKCLAAFSCFGLINSVLIANPDCQQSEHGAV